MSEGHGWVGGKFYATLADVPCRGVAIPDAGTPWVICGKPAASWRGWCLEHGGDPDGTWCGE